MVHILETLQRLETKFDSLSVASAATPASSSALADGASLPYTRLSERTAAPHHEVQHPEVQHPEGHAGAEQYFPKELQRSYRHLTAAHKIILWPSIYLHIINTSAAVASDLNFVLQDGTPWFIHLELSKHPDTLACDSERFTLLASGMEYGDPRTGFPALSLADARRLSEAYFNKFNIIHPVLDRPVFEENILKPMMQSGYRNGDPAACIGLLVLALGQVAIDGVYGQPVSYSADGIPSGLRGGTVERPPGLGIFNEARRRIGFVMNQCTLENVQIFLLQATYYEACARHMDFWRSTVAASLSCQVLIRCEPIEWESTRADMIKRAYWTCILSEE